MDVKVFSSGLLCWAGAATLLAFLWTPGFAQQAKLASGKIPFYQAENLQGTFRQEAGKPGRFYVGMEVSYLLLNGLDLVTTFYGLERGAQEANPIANYMIKNKPLTVAAKTGLSLGTLWAVRQMRKENRTAATVTLGILNLLYSGVVANNLRVVVQL